MNEKMNTILIIFVSLIINILKINVISLISANIIQGIQHNKIEDSYKYFKYFIIISITYVIIYIYYKHLQNKLLTKLRHNLRLDLTKSLLKINNENFNEMNFTKLNSPILRISNNCFYIFNNITNVFIPNITLILIVFFYFFYKNISFGLIFITGNILVLLYLYLNSTNIYKHNIDYEDSNTNTESYLVEILNNFDKIIHRGSSNIEVENFSNLIQTTIQKGITFYSNSNYHTLIVNIIIFVTIFLCIWYIIYLFSIKKITATIFITFMTILLLYRDIIFNTMQQIPDIIEFIGRSRNIINIFNKLDENYIETLQKKYDTYHLPFDLIEFENVSFTYNKKANSDYLLKNINLKIDTTNKIIGINGLSGKGKSTLTKLMIKMYKYKGTIKIDKIDIKEIDADYIRKNIIYINQSSKLFDMKLIKNIMYGCHTEDNQICKKYFDEIMSFEKIKELFTKIDFNKEAGYSGDNISGGQKQVINIINGLITPSKIIILDEPTNALDHDLKMEIIHLIKYFKKYKKCIIIITHDKELNSIFDDTIIF
jgi:ABC-type multidrug transport system fused ATPase/permease subunit